MIQLQIETVEQATNYIKDNNIPYEKVDEQRTWGSDEVNRVWWKDTAFRLSDEGMKKVAHYNSKQKVLVIY